jgi:hypothetical protein
MSRGPKSDKLWSQAVRIAAFREYEDPDTPGERRKALNIIAENLVKSAMAGDMQAIKEIGERLDGKAPQALIHANDPENPLTRPDELSDAELARIAAAGSAGASAETPRKGKPH